MLSDQYKLWIRLCEKTLSVFGFFLRLVDSSAPVIQVFHWAEESQSFLFPFETRETFQSKLSEIHQHGASIVSNEIYLRGYYAGNYLNRSQEVWLSQPMFPMSLNVFYMRSKQPWIQDFNHFLR